MLARAGLARLGRLDEVTEVLDPLQMLPAPGQGALAVECRADDADLVAAAARRSRRPATRAAVDGGARRARHPRGRLLRPDRALAEVVEGEDGEELWVRAVALSLDGGLSVRMSATGPIPPTPQASGPASRARCSPTGAADLMQHHQ